MMRDLAIQLLEDNSTRIGLRTDSRVIIPMANGEECELFLKGCDVHQLICDIGTGTVHVEAINLNKL